jgi:hypothetical protein
MPSEYDTDVALWAENQARALRAAARSGTNLPIDWENVAEEIEGVAASQKREVRSRLRRICQHLLKWHLQPDHQSPSWQNTIVEQRRQLQDLFEDSPSLRQFAENALPAAYNNGREDAELETRLQHLPNQCPWTFEQVVAHDFWPD